MLRNSSRRGRQGAGDAIVLIEHYGEPEWRIDVSDASSSFFNERRTRKQVDVLVQLVRELERPA